MALHALLCTDGSEAATNALRAGLSVLGPIERISVITVIDPVDPALMIGGGHAGPVMSPSEAQHLDDERRVAADMLLADTVAALELATPHTEVVYGTPGPAICAFAAEQSASVIVLGTSGRGGFRRAFLGSVSDHVVRHAPCPVVTTGHQD